MSRAAPMPDGTYYLTGNCRAIPGVLAAFWRALDAIGGSERWRSRSAFSSLFARSRSRTVSI
ncbi:MAG: hypothetical protein ACFB9N_17740 [Geitlerinemataceae cyanobacterium]